MTKKTKKTIDDSIGPLTDKDIEVIGFVAKMAAGLPLEDWDIEWWIRDNYDIKKIEFIRDHARGKLYAIELNDGVFYRALWIEGDPPLLEVEVAGPETAYPTIPEIVKNSKVISKVKAKKK